MDLKSIFNRSRRIVPVLSDSDRAELARMTRPIQDNFMPFLSFLPRKFEDGQREASLDISKLKSYSTDELLDILVQAHPKASMALWSWLRLANSGIDVKVCKDNGNQFAEGQKVIDEIIASLDTPPGTNYVHSRSLDKIVNQCLRMVMVRAATGMEVVLTEDVSDVQEIVTFDPATFKFTREGDRLIPWQRQKNVLANGGYKRLDIPSLFWETIDELPDDPYGTKPLLPLLNAVFFQLQVLQDLKAAVHMVGYPRMEVSVLEEVLIKNAPGMVKNNKDELKKWLAERLKEYSKAIAGLNPDDAFVHWDSLKPGIIGTSGGTTPRAVDVGKLIEIVEADVETACKTLATIVGRHVGNTETYSSVEAQLYIRGIESIQKIVARMLSRALTFCLRVKGKQGYVWVTFKPVDLRSDDQKQKDAQARLANILTVRERTCSITDEEMGTLARLAIGLDGTLPANFKDMLAERDAKKAAENAPQGGGSGGNGNPSSN